jgi:hypothetical protein
MRGSERTGWWPSFCYFVSFCQILPRPVQDKYVSNLPLGKANAASNTYVSTSTTYEAPCDMVVEVDPLSIASYEQPVTMAPATRQPVVLASDSLGSATYEVPVVGTLSSYEQPHVMAPPAVYSLASDSAAYELPVVGSPSSSELVTAPAAMYSLASDCPDMPGPSGSQAQAVVNRKGTYFEVGPLRKQKAGHSDGDDE